MDPVILRYASFSSDYIYAASLLTALSIANLCYIIYCLFKTSKLRMNSEKKSLSILYLTLIGVFDLGKSY